MNTIADQAETYYYQGGLNCAQAVFQSCLDDDRDTADLVYLAKGMGGGLGSSGNLCGAINGAFLGLSHYYRDDPRIQSIFQEYLKILHREYPSFQCRDIKDDHNTKGLKSVNCLTIVRRCAELCHEMKEKYPRVENRA